MTNYRADGAIIKYIKPKLIAKNERLEVGVGLQTNSSDYYLTFIVRCLKEVSTPGDLTIQYNSNLSDTFKLYHAEKSYKDGSDVYLAVYYLTANDAKNLKNNKIRYISFKDGDTLNAMTAYANQDVLNRAYSCLQ